MLKKLAFVFCLFPAVSALADSPTPRPHFAGLYVGAHAGYAWGSVDHSQTNGGMPVGPFSYEPEGALGGLTLGYNLNLHPLVLGVEAEGGWLDLNGEGRIASSVPTKYQTIDLDGGGYGLIAGRVGFTWSRTLFYGKAGYAWFDGDAGQKTTNPGYETVRSGSFEGTVYGGGIEHMISERWSLKAEYLHFDFDPVSGYQESISDPPVGFKYTNETNLEADTFKLGLNVKLW
jgi:outer membrane immunogenic protein